MKIMGSSLQMLVPPEKAGGSVGDAEKQGQGNSIADMSVSKAMASEKSQLKAKAKSQDSFDAQLRQAAQLYEAQFLREMVKGLRNTVPESELTPKSQGEKIFQGMLDENYVDQWAARGGVGLADMIYQQLQQKMPTKIKGSK